MNPTEIRASYEVFSNDNVARPYMGKPILEIDGRELTIRKALNLWKFGNSISASTMQHAITAKFQQQEALIDLLRERAENAESEIAALRGAAVPVAEIKMFPFPGCKFGERRQAMAWVGKQDKDFPVGTKFYTHPAPPVVVLPAMTEQVREELTADCLKEISQIENQLATWGDVWVDYLNSKLNRQKIALAALTTKSADGEGD